MVTACEEFLGEEKKGKLISCIWRENEENREAPIPWRLSANFWAGV